MSQSPFRVSAAIAVLVLWGGPAFAQLLPKEKLNELYELTMGTQGSGTDAVSETGYKQHGAYGLPAAGVGAIRFYHGETGESQESGQHDMAWKNFNGPNELVTDVFDSLCPKTNTTYFGGDAFDGTALWVAVGRFDNGGAPGVNSTSPPTLGTSPVASVATGCDVRRLDADLTLITVTNTMVVSNVYLVSADVYVPAHANKQVFVGMYSDRQTFGLLTPGGMGLVKRTFNTNEWSELEIRVTIVTDGGALADSSDDSGTLKQEFYINGAASGTRNDTLNTMQMQLRQGPVRISMAFGLQRGWQSCVPDFFVDNITMSEVFVPPPSGVVISIR